MEIDSSPASSDSAHLHRIIQRLSRVGVPEKLSNQGPRALVEFSKSKSVSVADLVYAVLPTDEDEVDKDTFQESLTWLQWFMFNDDPEAVLEHLVEVGSNERGVCGAVWGNNDIAYRCRTCEHDPTCAICVPCFENGNHKDHDYSIIYTGGGCCDCGDITAWKREGFCSKHKGAEQIQPLPKRIEESLGPVLDVLLAYWKDKLLYADGVAEGDAGAVSFASRSLEALDMLSLALVEMLLDFCQHSESLLGFISERIYSSQRLLEILLSVEKFMNNNVVGKLHELLLKMLGDPVFKYEFAKVFVGYYPTVVNAAISEGNDTAFKKYPLLSTFSVQILTVPTLTPRLVEESNLLDILFQCLEKIFTSFGGEDGRLQVVKWANLYETTLRVVEDVRFVMSHSVVPRYICNHRRDLLKIWMKLLTYVQGMNTLKRETGNHVDDENENIHLPFVLCHSISNILNLLVGGAFSRIDDNDHTEVTSFRTCSVDCEDQDNMRHAKVGRLSHESSIGNSITGKSTLDNDFKAASSSPIPPSALWLFHECLKSIENWLNSLNTAGNSTLAFKTSSGSGNNFLALKRTLSNFRRGRYLLRSSSAHSRPTFFSEDLNKSPSPSDDNYTKSVLGLLEWGQPPSDENHLVGESSGEIEGLRILNSQEWPDITYDVSTQEISVHIPLHRLLSVALHRALKDCYGSTQSSSYAVSSNLADPYVARHAEFFGLILDGCHPDGFSSFLMEHPLRIRVFCAEVHAGMWRRNGDAPILFREWYRSVRWSEQGQELDLFLLQCCAALAPPDLYVQRLVQRFRLSNYLSLNANQSTEHETVLMVEMLTLLIHIVKERRFCGLTNAECLERELVYKLATGDATRSQIIKSLPRDLSKVDELQTVLDRVAEYSHPSGINQGTYKLRSSFWKELDLYHPRWNLRDRQTAEERYSRFCNVSALTAQLPRWSKIYYPLKGIAKVATCGTLLQVVRAVLYYAASSDEPMKSRAPDAVVLTALHLLALSLDVCQVHRGSGDILGNVVPVLSLANEETGSGKYGSHSLLSLLVILMRNHETEDSKHLTEAGNFSLSSLVSSVIKTLVELEPACLTKLWTLDPQLANQFSNAILNDNAKSMDFTSDSEMRKAKSREKQAAILEKMRAQQSKFLDSIQSNGDVEMDDVQSDQDACNSEEVDDAEESPQVICSLCHDPNSRSPVSFLVLLQKSRLLSCVNRGPHSWDDLVSSSDKQNASGNESTGSISHSSDDTTSSSPLEASVKNAVDSFAAVGKSVEVNAFVELIKERFPSMKSIQLPRMPKDEEGKAPSLEGLEEHIFSLIRDFQSKLNVTTSQEINAFAGSLLLGKYIAALPKEPPLDSLPAQNNRASGVMSPESCGPGPGYDNFSNNGGDGVYVSSCGHAVHQGCLDRYLSSLGERFTRRILFEGRHIVDPDQGEFLCPVCRGLANSVLPALPGPQRKVSQSSSGSKASVSSDIFGSLCLQDGLFLIKKVADITGDHENLRALPTSHVKIETNLEPIMRVLCGMYYQRNDKISESGRVSHPLLLWDTLKYSIMSVEIAARSVKDSLNPNYSVGALYKELNSPSGFILSLLLDVVQCTRKIDSKTALLRLQGIQLFAQSFFPGSSPDEMPSYSCSQDMLYILEKAEPNVRYPDTQLCRLASEPILTRDAFSSLMWLLFCLPWPMLYCKESFLSLVHVFYVVAVVQAMIICRGQGKSIGTDPTFHDNVFADLCRITGNDAKDLGFFGCHSINPAYGFNDMIRSFTFPYLRRCALLWKLIFSKFTPFGDGAQSSSGESLHDLDYSTNSLDELSEVKKLERMLNIPTLDFICNDQVTRTSASRWLAHYSEAYKTRRYEEGALRCNPAVPFKLMVLPHLYHNLLQRYIKKNCPECGGIKEEPALCLLCGQLCSPGWKTCCSCQTHASVCGAGTGVFLLVRKTTILLQRSARQAPWPSPYLDAYGEEDVEMSRGKPLYLNEERYACLSYMVASHGLDRSSKVLRQTTTGAFFML